jgi:5,10-methenyltetrahydrofolate synthetase
MTIGLYWPIRGEFDPRFAARALRARGARTALPEVVQRAAPLRFRLWWPGVPMHLGEYGIPTPRDTPAVVPQALLIPALGFDAGGYRLGYGSGYYDRTLAALRPQPLKIGIAFECCRMPTIHPQAHDIPLDLVVTEAGMRCAQAGGPDTVADPGEVLERLAELVAQRNGGAAEGSNASGAPQADAGDARRFSSPVCYLEELERERERQKQR